MSRPKFLIPNIYRLIHAPIKKPDKQDISAQDASFNTKIGMLNGCTILSFGRYSRGCISGLAQTGKVIHISREEEELKEAKEQGIGVIAERVISLSIKNKADWLFSFESEEPRVELLLIIVKALAETRCGIKLLYRKEQADIEKMLKRLGEIYGAKCMSKRVMLKTKENKEVIASVRLHTLYTLETNKKARELGGTDLKLIEELQKKTKEKYEDGLVAELLDLARIKEITKKLRIKPYQVANSLKRIDALSRDASEERYCSKIIYE